ncbi:MAG TPA: O-antigen ligase family protein [Anaerolineaceae bacterium]|nr:O-antigen ligase family protein [Anaerolineaceae bacterium]
MISIQKLLTTSGALFRNRLTGFAFEPSWLAHQMNMFYIPIWAGLSFTRKSAFRKIRNRYMVEDIFLFFSIVILFLSKSRVGYITFIFVVFYLLYRLHKLLVLKLGTINRISNKKILIKILPFILLVFYLTVIIGGLFFFSKFDSRMENLLNIEMYRNRNIFSIANEFVFAERVLYWQTGWQIFNEFPILGVGLGNSGFFFKDYLPSFAWALEEPRHLIFQANYQGNIKNLWIRLLSETGMVGFLSFCIWLLTRYFISVKLELAQTSKNRHRHWGLIGKIALISLFFEGFSIDSFALPYYWIVLGMVVANYMDIDKDELN